MAIPRQKIHKKTNIHKKFRQHAGAGRPQNRRRGGGFFGREVNSRKAETGQGTWSSKEELRLTGEVVSKRASFDDREKIRSPFHCGRCGSEEVNMGSYIMIA